MDRLTKYSKETTHENGVCCTHFGGMECFACNGDCSRGCTWEEAAWSRLAAYEDTGLTPEQCENAKVIIESAFSNDTSKAERILELLKADMDGRLVVLPCKVGDPVYLIVTKRARNYTPEFRFVKKSRLTFLNMERILQDFGKEAFLTHEEAEAALEAMKDE
nr:MAG TPA: hypothetical protein [Caudoviricetes sp.]